MAIDSAVERLRDLPNMTLLILPEVAVTIQTSVVLELYQTFYSSVTYGKLLKHFNAVHILPHDISFHTDALSNFTQ